MKIRTQYVLNVIFTLIIILNFSSANYAQNDLRLVGIYGTFSINSLKGDLPVHMLANQTIEVDPSSSIVVKSAMANTDVNVYYLVGANQSIKISDLFSSEAKNSNDDQSWNSIITAVKKGIIRATGIKTTYTEKKVQNLLSNNNFEVQFEFPDKNFLLVQPDPLVSEESSNTEDNLGNFGEITMDDTVSVVLLEPADIKPGETIQGKYESLLGQWKIIIKGNEYSIIFSTDNSILIGHLMLKNNRRIRLSELVFEDQIVSFMIPDFQQNKGKFFGNAAKSQQNKIYGLYKVDNSIHTWFGEK